MQRLDGSDSIDLRMTALSLVRTQPCEIAALDDE
jgi:hypothetical protein